MSAPRCSRWRSCTPSPPATSSISRTRAPRTRGYGTCWEKSKPFSASGPSCCSCSWRIAYGWSASSAYLDSRQFVEPMFVFVIMVVAASRPIMQVASDGVRSVARLLPAQPAIAGYFLSLSLVPLLGSFITEPAAMTLAALMLRERIFATDASSRLKYATLGVLFVNVSVGGTLTNFAAPAGSHGGGAVGLDHGIHAVHIRRQGRACGPRQCARSDVASSAASCPSAPSRLRKVRRRACPPRSWP